MKQDHTSFLILLFALFMQMSCSDDNDIKLNQLPEDFGLVSPQDGAVNVSISPVLEWEEAQDLDGDLITYFIYLDDHEVTTLVAGEVTKPEFQLSEPLEYNTNYQWKVVAKDALGASSRSAIYSFTTENDPPGEFELVLPENEAEKIPVATQLVWEASSNLDGDSIVYNIYFGTEENPPLVAENLGEDDLLFQFFEFPEPITYVYYEDLPVLQYETTYNWKVEAVDAQGAITESEMFSFTTDIEPKWLDIQASGFLQIADHSSVVFDNKLWVIDNQIAYTSDGFTWELISPDHGISNLFGHSSVVFDGKMWIIGSTSHGVWSSTNGVNWTEVNASPPFSSYTWHSSVVFDNKMWVIGGFTQGPGDYHNEVWYSENGVDWNEVVTTDVFSPRYGHTSVVYDNKIWVIGGLGPDNTVYNDVWYSEDGTSWVQATDDAQFTPRYHHSSVVYDNKMWVIGGDDTRETWYSSGGINWSLLENSENEPLPPIEKHTSAVFNNNMYILGGSSFSDVYKTVWISNF